MSIRLLSIIIIISISGCDNQRVDRSGIQEEKERRALKKVTEAEILNEASSIGKEISLEAEKNIGIRSQKILENLNQDQVSTSIVKEIHNVDSLEEAFQAEINYISLITSNKEQEISPIETELLDAYQFNIERNISLSENIQKIEEDYLLYNKPLLLENPSCLRCHGLPGKDVDEETLSALQQNYPTSQLTGFSIGSVMGFWSIRLSQKKIVQDL